MTDDPAVPSCAWCGEPAVTEVITRPGRKNRQTAPVCETHAKEYEDRDILTTRLEFERRQQSAEKRKRWLEQQRGGR